jgi:hypothetical protein
LPCYGIKGCCIPLGVTSGGGLGALDEVVTHGGGVACRANVVGDVVGYLPSAVKEGSAGARNPCGK